MIGLPGTRAQLEFTAHDDALTDPDGVRVVLVADRWPTDPPPGVTSG